MTALRPTSGSRALRLPLPSSFGRPLGSRVDLRHPRRPRHEGTDLETAVVDCAVYAGGTRLGGRRSLREARAVARERGGFLWIGLHEPDGPALQAIADELDLHPLAVEDAVHAHQRPKLETYGADALFLVLKTVRYVDREEVVQTGELMAFLGPGYVVTVRHGEGGDLAGVRADLEARPDLLAAGPSAVLYAVVDRVVDGYDPAVAAVEEDVDEIEDQVFGPSREQPTARIYKLKREVLAFRRAVEPLVPATAALAGGELGCLDPRTTPYFRDVHDHVVRSAELVGGLDELLGSVLSANLAQVSMRQNEDTRRISAWVAIAAVDTLIAGVYGMNFEHMPELGWAYGYAWALLLMTVSSLMLYLGFKRNHWL